MSKARGTSIEIEKTCDCEPRMCLGSHYRVLVNGEEMDGLFALSIDWRSDDVPRAVLELTVEDLEVDDEVIAELLGELPTALQEYANTRAEVRMLHERIIDLQDELEGMEEV